MARVLSLAAGSALLVLTWTIVVFTIVLPRGQQGPGRVSTIATRGVRAVFATLAHVTRDFERKDTMLAPIGPVAVLAQLLVWLALFGIAFVLMLTTYTHHFGTALSQAVAAMFTLGQARTAHLTNDTITTLAGATGLVVIGLQIAYLPSLYATFNQREALTTMLTSRAGEPAWGPEILIRHQLVGITDALPDFYGSWEQWAAEVSESHVSYPVLLLFRSPDPWSSWVLSLLSVMRCRRDAPRVAARHGTLAGAHVPAHGIRRVAAHLGVARLAVRRRPAPRRAAVAHVRRVRGHGRLARRGRVPDRRDAESAWPHFRGSRVNYEDLSYRWAQRVQAPLAPWSGTRPGLTGGPIAPRRPAHRSPDDPRDPLGYQRPEFPLPG